MLGQYKDVEEQSSEIILAWTSAERVSGRDGEQGTNKGMPTKSAQSGREISRQIEKNTFASSTTGALAL